MVENHARVWGRKNAKRYFNDVFALRRDASGAYAWEKLLGLPGSDSSAPSKRNHHAAAAVNGSSVGVWGSHKPRICRRIDQERLVVVWTASSAWTEIGWMTGASCGQWAASSTRWSTRAMARWSSWLARAQTAIAGMMCGRIP